MRADHARVVGRVALVGVALGESDVVPAAVVLARAAFGRQAVQLERREERMQQARMIVVAAVFDVELPVVVHELAVAAENLDLAVQRALDVLDHHRAEVVAKRRRRARERAEDQTAYGLDAQPDQPMLRLVEIGRHAAFLLDAFFERDAGQVAVEIVNPVVVRANEVVGARACLWAGNR